MNAAAGKELGTEETQNNNRGCNKVARKWWVELRWRLLNMTRRTTSWIFRKPRSFCVLARFVAVLSKLTQCCDEDAGVFGYQQLHLEMFFCLESRPESRVRKQKHKSKYVSFVAYRVVKKRRHKSKRTTEATPTSRRRVAQSLSEKKKVGGWVLAHVGIFRGLRHEPHGPMSQ